MNICKEHWDTLRSKIEALGLMPFVATDGKTAARMLNDQIEKSSSGIPHDRDGVTKDNFDPLMGAWFAISNNGAQFIKDVGANPLYTMVEGPEEPVDTNSFPTVPEGTTWPRCVICYLNLGHKLTCREPRCKLDKERGYDWMIDKAAEGSLEEAKRLGLLS